MSAKLRKRKLKPEQSNGEDKIDGKPAGDHASSPRKTSHSILILLVVMVTITWGIAASAYFGLVDYKALAGIKETIDTTERSSVHETVPVNDQDKANSEQHSSEAQDASENLKSPSKAKDTVKDKEVKKNPAKKPQKSSQTKKKSENGKEKKFTSAKDKPILQQLQDGDAFLAKKKAKEAFALFDKLISSNPDSPRAWFGKAESLNMRSLQERSNKVLQESLQIYEEVAKLPNCPKGLKKKALLIKTERHHFLGQLREAYRTISSLAKDLPGDVDVLNQLGVSYLWIGKNDKAQNVYEQVLSIDPDNGFAQVHLGFIIKLDGDWVKGAHYLSLGIHSMAEGTQEGKFYFHLGDALHRTNRTEEAEKLYQLGADRGMFRSKYQRSLYNVDRLQSHPFWTHEEAKATDYVKKLETNWKMIRDEALAIMDVDKGLFLPEEETLKDTGEWRQLTLYSRGREDKDCRRLPKTCRLVGKMPNAHACTRGQVKFSIMMPGTHVWPHTGPTNCRLRMHLGLVIPTTGEGARLKCAGITTTWKEGEVLIFDDSFEHEVWQNAETFRLILIVDIWHPDITEREKKTLSPI